jgi:hypothetical protein
MKFNNTDAFTEISILDQLVLHIENNLELLKEAYEKRDKEAFVKIKRAILKTQKEIDSLVG